MGRTSHFNLLAAGRDLVRFLAIRERHEILAGIAAVVVTGWILYAFAQDSYAERQPRIVYVENWPANRTDAEIEADTKVYKAEKKKALDARTAEFRKLADAMGIDYKK